MSFDATRAVWALRRAGRLPGGTPLLVLLALADHANRRSGEASTSLRYLAEELGLHYSQVSRALKIGRESGAIDLVKANRGRAKSVYRFNLARPEDNAEFPTVLPEGSANGSVALHDARPSSNSARPSSNATDALQQPIPVTRSLTRPPGPRAEVETPATVALALMVGVETRIEETRGTSRRPDALAATIERRLAGSYGARLAGMVAEGLSPERAAALALVEDGVCGPCPLDTCSALDAKPITDEAKCPRHHSCPFYVGAQVSS